MLKFECYLEIWKPCCLCGEDLKKFEAKQKSKEKKIKSQESCMHMCVCAFCKINKENHIWIWMNDSALGKTKIKSVVWMLFNSLGQVKGIRNFDFKNKQNKNK